MTTREEQAPRNQEDKPERDCAGNPPTGRPLRALFGRRVFMPGEASADYNALYEQIRRAAAPCDGLEEIWVRDVVDEVWQCIRLKRMRAGFLRDQTSNLLTRLLKEAGVGEAERNRIVEGLSRDDVSANVAIYIHLSKSGDNLDTVAELASARCRSTLRCLDQMITSAESRRDKALRAIGRHRECLGQRLRAATKTIDDAELSGSATRAGAER